MFMRKKEVSSPAGQVSRERNIKTSAAGGSQSSPPKLEDTLEETFDEFSTDDETQSLAFGGNASLKDKMKGLSVGLVSPDCKKRSPSLDMSEALAQQAAQLQKNEQNAKDNDASENFFAHDTSQDLSPIRSIDSPPSISRQRNLSPTPPNSFRFDFPSLTNSSIRRAKLRSALKHNSIEDALELEAIVTREEHEEDLQDEELLRSAFDLFCNRLSGKNRSLAFILGFAAFCDCLACLSPIFLHREEDEKDVTAKTEYLYSYLMSIVGKEIEERGPIRSALAFLGHHGDTIGIFFSVLWFLHSFGHAARVRKWVIRMRDRKRLLEEDGDSTSLDNAYPPLNKKDSQDSSASAIIDSVGGAWGVYVVMVGWQLLLLPVGFYTTIYQVFTGDAAQGLHHVPKCIGDHCTMATVVTSKFKQSLLYVICQQAVYYVSHRVKEEVKEEFRNRFARLKRFLMKFAIRHPMEFRRKLRKTLRWLRWIRYAIPLIGGLNKLKGNMQDLLKKYRQRRDAKVLQRCFKELSNRKRLRDLSASAKTEHAPIIIQSAWRARQKRKEKRALKLFQLDPEIFAAMKLQVYFRTWLARSRARLKRKKIELALLQEMERRTRNGKDGPHTSAAQRKRMYQLQEELKLAAKKRRQTKMLLRPNTRFAVTWKFIFVSCLLIEITQLAMKPKLKQFHEELAVAQKRKLDPKDMDWYTFMQAKLVPTPAPEWDECGKALQAGNTPPWFCNRPFTDIHTFYIRTLEFTIAEALAFISVVMFADVFISFFTGEIDDVSGELVPKPFFKRYILPGILIQLLLNPRMMQVSAAVKAFIRHIISDIGPVTAWRWSLALFIPLFGYASERFNRHVWKRFVREENARAAY